MVLSLYRPDEIDDDDCMYMRRCEDENEDEDEGGYEDEDEEGEE